VKFAKATRKTSPLQSKFFFGGWTCPLGSMEGIHSLSKQFEGLLDSPRGIEKFNCFLSHAGVSLKSGTAARSRSPHNTNELDIQKLASRDYDLKLLKRYFIQRRTWTSLSLHAKLQRLSR